MPLLLYFLDGISTHDLGKIMIDAPKNQFVFTLEEPQLEPSTHSATHPVEHQAETVKEEFDWEAGLEAIRQRRHPEAVERYTEPNVEPKYTRAAPVRSRRNTLTTAETEAMIAYLKEWQKEQNQGLEDAPTEDATVVLQEDWLAAQSALQGDYDSAVVDSHTVWLKAKPSAEQSNTEYLAHDVAVHSDTTIDVEDVPVTVNVLMPEVVHGKPVVCLSERELISRLSERLRTHMADAVAGMVRTAVQRQAAALTHHLQQSLIEETPQLVEEILDYNFDAVMAEIRYDLKHKR